jgi:acyl-ACP thioesterase
MDVLALSELVPPPQQGRVFEQVFRPGFADCAPSGRMRLDAVARWLQDVAYADVVDAELVDRAVWVVRRTRIRAERFPSFGEAYRLATFCSGLGRMWAERRTSIGPVDGPGSDIEAVTLWVHLDPRDWRPVPLSPEEEAAYAPAAGGRRVRARLRHPLPRGGEESSSWSFRATELDLAGHVNNTAYWQPVEEELLAHGEVGWADVEVEYRTPAQAGEKLLLRDGAQRWIVGPEAEVHASIMLAGVGGMLAGVGG